MRLGVLIVSKMCLYRISRISLEYTIPSLGRAWYESTGETLLSLTARMSPAKHRNATTGLSDHDSVCPNLEKTGPEMSRWSIYHTTEACSPIVWLIWSLRKDAPVAEPSQSPKGSKYQIKEHLSQVMSPYGGTQSPHGISTWTFRV